MELAKIKSKEDAILVKENRNQQRLDAKKRKEHERLIKKELTKKKTGNKLKKKNY